MRFGGGRRFGNSNRRFGDSGGRRFDRRESDLPKPLKVGEEYDVEIKEVGSKGDGIARVSNFVVFVNGTKMGDKVHIKITDVRDRFAIGEVAGSASAKEESSTESTEEVKETSSNDDWDSDEESEDESSEEESEDE